MITKHTLEDREDGLASCRVCKGGESSLPTHCPGRPMDAGEQDRVSLGTLDFRDGYWTSELEAQRGV